jgi:hypothetical protein
VGEGGGEYLYGIDACPGPPLVACHEACTNCGLVAVPLNRSEGRRRIVRWILGAVGETSRHCLLLLRRSH